MKARAKKVQKQANKGPRALPKGQKFVQQRRAPLVEKAKEEKLEIEDDFFVKGSDESE